MHFGGLALAFYSSCLRMVKESSWVGEHSQNLGTDSTTTSSLAPYFAQSYPTLALYPSPLVFFCFFFGGPGWRGGERFVFCISMGTLK